jgi:hypothetical protein
MITAQQGWGICLTGDLSSLFLQVILNDILLPVLNVCCQFGLVAPAGVRSIARMRACLVSGRVTVFEDEGADRERGLDLLVVRAAKRVEALDFGLDLVMGSSEVMRRHPPHHLSPARAKAPGRVGSRSPSHPLQVTTATLRSDTKASHF